MNSNISELVKNGSQPATIHAQAKAGKCKNTSNLIVSMIRKNPDIEIQVISKTTAETEGFFTIINRAFRLICSSFGIFHE